MKQPIKSRNWHTWISAAFVIATSLFPIGDSRAEPSAYGLPNRITHLGEKNRLGPESGLSLAQRTEVLLYWLANERHEPQIQSLAPGLLNDGGYVQSQFIAALFEKGDAALLDTISLDKRVAPWAREAAQLGLGLKGDKAQVPTLIRVLKTEPGGEFRILAAHALGVCGAKEAIPDLEAAVKSDTYTRPYNGCTPPPHAIAPDGTYYPVREEAKEALRNLRDDEVVAFNSSWFERFRGGLKEHRAGAAVIRPASLAPWLLAKIGVDAPQEPKSRTDAGAK